MNDKQIKELDFTLEFNSDTELGTQEDILYDVIYNELKPLAEERHDIVGAAATLRRHGDGFSAHAYEATIVAYVRPSNIAATKKADSPEVAVEEALEALVRQIRQKRQKLGKPWEQPKNDPEIKKMLDAELGNATSEETVREVYSDEE